SKFYSSSERPKLITWKPRLFPRFIQWIVPFEWGSGNARRYLVLSPCAEWSSNSFRLGPAESPIFQGAGTATLKIACASQRLATILSSPVSQAPWKRTRERFSFFAALLAVRTIELINDLSFQVRLPVKTSGRKGPPYMGRRAFLNSGWDVNKIFAISIELFYLGMYSGVVESCS